MWVIINFIVCVSFEGDRIAGCNVSICVGFEGDRIVGCN